MADPVSGPYLVDPRGVGTPIGAETPTGIGAITPIVGGANVYPPIYIPASATGKLAADYSTGSPTITLQAGQVAAFPPNGYFRVRIGTESAVTYKVATIDVGGDQLFGAQEEGGSVTHAAGTDVALLGAWYLPIGEYDNFPGGNPYGHSIRIYRSDDEGVTWWSMDEANIPPDSTGCVSVLRVGSALKILYSAGDINGSVAFGPLRIATFLNDRFGALSPSGPTPTPSGTNTLRNNGCLTLASIPNGDLFALYRAADEIKYAKYSAGSWGAETDFIAGPTMIPGSFGGPYFSAYTDVNGVIHVLYGKVTGTAFGFGFVGDIRHITLNGSDETVGPDTVVDTSKRFQAGSSQLIEWEGKLVSSFISDNYKVWTYIGDAATSLSPSWTTEAVYQLAGLGIIPPGGTSQPAQAVVSPNGDLTVSWLFNAQIIPFHRGVSQLQYAVRHGAGSWGAPVTYYDAALNPYDIPIPIPPSDIDIYNVWRTYIGTKLVATLTMTYQETPDHEGSFIILAGLAKNRSRVR